MSANSYGSVVAMEFAARPDISFSDFVEDFDAAFQMVDSTTNSLSWERDTLAIIDRDYVRVAVGWLPSAGKDSPWHLIYAVGSSPDEDLSKIELSSYDFLADRILDRTNDVLPATAVLRGEASQPIGPKLIDTLFELLCTDTSDLPADTDLPDPVIREEAEEDYADMVETMVPPWAKCPELDDRYSKELFDKAEEALVKKNAQKALNQKECSDPMRLTIHTLALSLCLYVPPLGAAMFAYTMLRDIFPVAASAI